MPILRLLFASLVLSLIVPHSAIALEESAMVKMLKQVDDRQKNNGDYKSLVYIERKERDKETVVFEVAVYRRDEKDKLMILFLKPKAEAGKGYLRLNKNLFMYDPTVGRWERRTERERIGGTDSRRKDFDQSRLAEEFTPAYAGEEKLGRFEAYRLKLKVKPGVDVAYPVIHMWLDKKTGNVLKFQEEALSGRLMRTTYYPKWNRLYSESKGEYVYFPKQINIYDEVEKGNSTLIVMRKVDLNSLPENIFTKAWLESKSR